MKKVKSIKEIVLYGYHVIRQVKLSVLITSVFIFVVVFSVVAVEVTSTPWFCNSCHIMNPFYDNWVSSDHNEVSCIECHLQPGFTNYVKGKINGMAQSVDCMVGRIGTKPNAMVHDSSCLRSKCHSSDKLAEKELRFKTVRFTHGKHLGKVVNGIKIGCNTCHSHFEGNEHFSVNPDACFTCHFLRSEKGENAKVKTLCTDCHEVPNKVIKRGLVTVNHSEFVEYEASCEEGCHKGQISHSSEMSDTVCLNCHSFRMDEDHDVEELHALHSGQDKHGKVECFGCHGRVQHGATDVASLAEMIECENCHSDTHQIQKSIYSASDHEGNGGDRTLGPMFLTHVECTGCHIDRGGKRTGVLDSIGTVAKAVPEACDNCHEKGTGKQYIPFWQNQISKLYDRAKENVDMLESRLRAESNPEVVKKLKGKISQARSILEAVSADGSKGVHNFKYTEAMLRKADRIITED